MGGSRFRCSLQALLLLLLAGFASSATFISDAVFASDSRGSAGRSLLQVKKPCPVNFEFLNYTIITSRCKGPRYLPKPCCDSLVEFACPYAAEINDLSNDCATTMFSYINLHGKYPPGLFANQCVGDKEGLPCPANFTKATATTENAGHWSPRPSSIAVFLVGFLLILLFV